MPRLSAYKGLELYQLSKKLVVACYELTHDLPTEEKTNLSRHIRVAALSVHLNITRGAFRKTKKRRKYFRMAQDCLIIISTATEILVEVNFTTAEEAARISQLSTALSQLLEQL